MSNDPDELLEDALPRCPRCLVLFDVEGDELTHLVCPQCGDVFL